MEGRGQALFGGVLQELIQRIAGARPSVDSGMLRVGPRLDKSSSVEALLAGGASRALSLADAVVQLCRQDHVNESLPLLRQLAEVAVVMHSARTEPAAAEIISLWENPRWEELWPASDFPARARGAGFSENTAQAVQSLCRDFTRANRALIPWSHVYESNQRPGTDSATVLGLTTELLDGMMRAEAEKQAALEAENQAAAQAQAEQQALALQQQQAVAPQEQIPIQ